MVINTVPDEPFDDTVLRRMIKSIAVIETKHGHADIFRHRGHDFSTLAAMAIAHEAPAQTWTEFDGVGGTGIVVYSDATGVNDDGTGVEGTGVQEFKIHGIDDADAPAFETLATNGIAQVTGTQKLTRINGSRASKVGSGLVADDDIWIENTGPTAYYGGIPAGEIENWASVRYCPEGKRLYYLGCKINTKTAVNSVDIRCSAGMPDGVRHKNWERHIDILDSLHIWEDDPPYVETAEHSVGLEFLQITGATVIDYTCYFAEVTKPT